MFPIVPASETGIETGMSLRDYFAASFAPELIKRNTGCGTSWEQVAKDAYLAADAMLEAREEKDRS